MERFIKVEKVNVKGKDYDINPIIESFYAQTEGYDYQCFRKDKDYGKFIAPSRLIYEAYKDSRDGKNTVGLCFWLNGNVPYYVAYRAILKDGCLIIHNEYNVIKRIILDGQTECMVPAAHPIEAIDYMESLKEPVRNFNEYIGVMLISSCTSSLIIENMNIQINYNDIIAGAISVKNIVSGRKCTKLDLYTAIGKRICDSRISGKDMTWYMYKMLYLDRIMR